MILDVRNNLAQQLGMNVKKSMKKNKALPGTDYKNAIWSSFRFIEPGYR